MTSHVHFSTICSDLPPLPKGPSNFTSHKFMSRGLAKTVKSERFPWQRPRLFTEMGRRIHQALALLLPAPSASPGASSPGSACSGARCVRLIQARWLGASADFGAPEAQGLREHRFKFYLPHLCLIHRVPVALTDLSRLPLLVAPTSQVRGENSTRPLNQNLCRESINFCSLSWALNSECSTEQNRQKA